jgi:hypothetical protein
MVFKHGEPLNYNCRSSHLPPPSRGRSGGGWVVLLPDCPIPTPTLPLKGREFLQREIPTNDVEVETFLNLNLNLDLFICQQ